MKIFVWQTEECNSEKWESNSTRLCATSRQKYYCFIWTEKNDKSDHKTSIVTSTGYVNDAYSKQKFCEKVPLKRTQHYDFYDFLHSSDARFVFFFHVAFSTTNE